MAKLAQSSLEYLLVLAFTMAILVPSVYIFYTSSKESNEQVADAQIQSIGNTIIENVRFVYYSGKGSKVTLEINMPSVVEEVYISGNREMVFKVAKDIGQSELVFFSDFIDMHTPEADIEPACKKESRDAETSICYLFREQAPGLVKVKIESMEDNKVRLSETR